MLEYLYFSKQILISLMETIDQEIKTWMYKIIVSRIYLKVNETWIFNRTYEPCGGKY
jgi:hypothetical protein